VVSWTRIAEHLAEVTNRPFTPRMQRSLGGGCISQAWVIADGEQRYFVKLNRAEKAGMFAAEAEGLRELQQANAVRVPHPVCWGRAGANSYLVLELLDLRGAKRAAAARLGRELACLHRKTNDRFGWHVDNTIGATPQINEPADNWIDFFGRQRLLFQLRLAEHNGYSASLQAKGERLVASLDSFFSGYCTQPSLLHGDLWSGNYGADARGMPVVFDPAVYYGDRETDLAMSELFGGFPDEFYGAYREVWPLDPGYGVRKILYNLYHVLNHLNLFGGGYLTEAELMLDCLLGEV
jgi:fructosamine-3-kinase